MTRPVASRADAERALEIVEAMIRTIVGDDAETSPLWVELSTLPGTDPDGWELGQDAALLAADVVECVRENLGNPQAMGLALLSVVAAAVPEIVADAKRLPRA
jgi:hypothetical protein